MSGSETLSKYSLSFEEKISSAIFLTTVCDYLYPVFGSLLAFIFFAGMIPRIAIAVRRLHDAGKSGLWIFLQLIPLLKIILLFWYAQPSKHIDNIALGNSDLK